MLAHSLRCPLNSGFGISVEMDLLLDYDNENYGADDVGEDNDYDSYGVDYAV